jgi:hypothetical protein
MHSVARWAVKQKAPEGACSSSEAGGLEPVLPAEILGLIHEGLPDGLAHGPHLVRSELCVLAGLGDGLVRGREVGGAVELAFDRAGHESHPSVLCLKEGLHGGGVRGEDGVGVIVGIHKQRG